MRLSEKYFELSENKAILLKWQGAADPNSLGEDMDPLLKEFYDQLISLGNKIPSSVYHDRKDRENTLNDCINRLLERHIRNRELEKKFILSEERGSGDVDSQLAKLIELDIKESQQLHDIFNKRGRLFSRTKGA